ncbi:lipocalin-like domain-containing protein [Paraglaciecola sp. 20A4]|uniref:lipocalin-like domain-containing protein n=1 Tax=Paraglaciecola sp. 20A4 TaxID=2687288 RepID=UPI00140C645C|nr:lipocalin-like domain-containing protein [Paraglaciecola sp. 20A4]
MAKLNFLSLAVRFALCVLLVLLLNACSDQPVNSNPKSVLFADSASPVTGKPADPRYIITLPADHLAHPDFNVEWWYVTANLSDENGDEYGFQWTLFRFKTSDQISSWDNGQSYMAHVSLHSEKQHWFAERFARGGVGNAGLTEQPLTLFLDDWQWQENTGQGSLFPSTITANNIANTQIKQPTQDAHLSLHLSTDGPFVLQGQKGYSVKSLTPPLASHYYSQPFIHVRGDLHVNGQAHQLTGQGWFDHEWSSQLMDANTAGWDWFSLHLDNGAKIMAFRMRLSGQADFISGSYIEPDGTSTSLSSNELILVPQGQTKVAGRLYPLVWRLKLANKNIDLKLQASKSDQLNSGRFTYYEGALDISGTHSGRGFMELTGY